MAGLTESQRDLLVRCQTLFEGALAAHQRGAFAEAEPLYREVLQILPRHTDSLHLLGTLRHQLGDHVGAVDLVEQAIRIAPGAASYHNHLGSALRALGRPVAAETSFKRAGLLNPAAAEAFLNLAIINLDRGDAVSARTPASIAVRLAPGSGPARLRYGATLRYLADWDRALEELEAAVRLTPLAHEAYLHLSFVREVDEGAAAAVDPARRGIVLSPEVYELYPRYTNGRATTTDDEGFLAWSRRSVMLNPVSDKLWNNLSAELHHLRRFAEGLEPSKRALVLNPGVGPPYNNLATCIFWTGDVMGALRIARMSHAFFPAVAEIEFTLSQAEFLVGDLDAAYRHYESRFKLAAAPKFVGLPPRWDGESPLSTPLFIHSEQGVGDEILFYSCLPELLRVMPTVTIECDRRFVPLLRRTFPNIGIVERQIALNAKKKAFFDYRELMRVWPHEACIPAGELATMFRRDRTVWGPPGYLTVDPTQAEAWRERLAGLHPSKKKIGVVWRSGMSGGFRGQFYCDLVDLARLVAGRDDCILVAVQHGDPSAQIDHARSETGVEIVRFEDLDVWNDLDGLAAMLSQLDVMVSAAVATSAIADCVGTPNIVLERGQFYVSREIEVFTGNRRATIAHDEIFGIPLALERARWGINYFLDNGCLPDYLPGNSGT